jgi:hypothetical protein
MRTTKLACVVMGPRAEAPGTRTKTRPVRGGRGQVAHQVSRPHGNGSHRAPGRATTRVSDHVFIPLNPEDAYADANHAPRTLINGRLLSHWPQLCAESGIRIPWVRRQIERGGYDLPRAILGFPGVYCCTEALKNIRSCSPHQPAASQMDISPAWNGSETAAPPERIDVWDG